MRAVAAGGAHTLAVSGAGDVYSFGGANFHQLGHGDGADQLTPRRIEALHGVRAWGVVAGGAGTACGLPRCCGGMRARWHRAAGRVVGACVRNPDPDFNLNPDLTLTLFVKFDKNCYINTYIQLTVWIQL